ncbi:GNAT family N-acetyltransferase [Paenibacillus sedimenti]|uniref:GNAT family N-acetyltransferase n=1 Tax=Paenibacillus sedimenti TaxID=2770274 RepID=A0A926KNS9_9BACL|nr:GNAT family N-acetyltransferase [Paenibacillus sedimenti]MBD0380151.1 GNAT family N-acetyltransferase [Paenibacillus sedimenti]
MISFRTFSDLSLKDAVSLWNKGFEQYFVPVTLTVDSFVQRSANEGISLDLSVVAFDRESPIGFVANGFRTYQGQKKAWNGGTGIIPDYRGKGIGKLLVERSIRLYKEQGVHLTTLEAISENERAIKLYEKMGYQLKDRLLILQNTEELPKGSFTSASNSPTPAFTLKKASPAELAFVPMYRGDRAWQTQWESLRSGELLLVCDSSSGDVIGYSLFRRNYNEQGELTAIILYQCESAPNSSYETEIINFLLYEVFAPQLGACKRMTMNLSSSCVAVVNALLNAGFTKHMEQVYMDQQL